ncbi:MAG: hypothetical protein ACR2G2_00925 [Pseudonocardia sp.]
MTPRKERLTVTIDPELLAAGTAAVAAGHADSLSAWVNQALSEQATRDQKLAALDVAIADYEARAGVISDDELRDQERADRASAVVVRGRGVA